MKDDQITQITVSTSRKLNHAVYGASDYESSDHFVSLGAEVNVGDNIVELHSELTELARELNNKALSRAILKIQGGYSWVDYLELLRQ